jgi:transposase-like protein
MPMNRIQFRRGVSMPELLLGFCVEARCTAALEVPRWPDGFVCPHCESSSHCVLLGRSHKMFQCNGCRYQTSIIAGTVFENTKLPLTSWFLGLHLIFRARTGLSALALKRHLGVSYPTAWLMHHKLMAVVMGALKPRDLPGLKWVNTILGNPKTNLAGCHQAFG